MSEHDLTALMAAQLDRHLVFPLLEFLQERQLYSESEILEAAAPLVAFLQNPQLVQEFRPDKQYNIHMLQERYQIGPDQIEALYQYAKFQFECGNYSGAADYLYQYRALCTNSERNVSALWGKLAAEILMQNWDVALEELNRLKEIIDSKNFSSPLNQLQNRIWLMHWALFIFFNHENGRNGIIDLFFQDRYLNAIQTNAHHLISYKDPVTEFLECLYVNYDFDGAQQKLIECEQVILNDPFLGKRIEEGNFVSVPLRDEFLENARLFIFETYCRIHRCIDISMLAQKLNMSYDEAELWIMNLVRSSKLDARIDSVSGTLIMTTNHVNVHEQIVESLKGLNMRTYMLAKNIVEPAQQATR
uniref:Eukaryotic translation initiation factor 3 subunit E n=1 Tax=Zea mays TaxID=4577 RepID=A0A804MLE9_MAIZE